MSEMHDMDESDARNMWMWYHTELDDTLWFKWWHVTDRTGMVISCVIIFMLGMLLEVIKLLRYRISERLFDRRGNGYGSGRPHAHSAYSTFSWTEMNGRKVPYTKPRLIDTILFGVQLSLAYVLMLVFMTFSLYLCTSLVAGCTLGFFLFSRRRPSDL